MNEHAPLGPSIHRRLTPMDVSIEANRCLYCYDAPCMQACPTHIDVPGFIGKIATGNITGSAQTILEANAMGASCARVCPTDELCEGACVYTAAGDMPIRIGDLQRYATDYVRERGIALFEAGAPTGYRVAIVGGGPAGLSAARDLRRFGHAVTIFDAHHELGGLNTFGIVPFRLDTGTALWEAEQVLALSAEARTGVRIGTDIHFTQLQQEFDAVIVACGMGGVPELDIEGEKLSGVWDALDFIECAKFGRDAGNLGSRIAVIGAGNTAIDALTCSKRLAPDAQVTCYYRRGEEHMTAYDFEYAFAKSEGIVFRFYCMPVRLIGAGRIEAIEFVKTNADAQPVDGSTFVEPVDTVIRAIGQSRLLEELDHIGVTHDGGVVCVDDAMATSVTGVFAAGDCIYAKGSREAMVVEAAEQGKIAARSVDRYLRRDH